MYWQITTVQLWGVHQRDYLPCGYCSYFYLFSRPSFYMKIPAYFSPQQAGKYYESKVIFENLESSQHTLAVTLRGNSVQIIIIIIATGNMQLVKAKVEFREIYDSQETSNDSIVIVDVDVFKLCCIICHVFIV